MSDKSPNSRWLKTPAWLAEQRGKPNVVVVDGSFYLPAQKRDPGAEYLAAHIPGAVFFDIDAVCDHSTDLPHMLAGPTEFAAAAGKLGISDKDTIVVYDGAGLSSAPRVWWNFRIMGAENVFMLDGGLPAWKAEGHPTEAGAVKRRAAHLQRGDEHPRRRHARRHSDGDQRRQRADRRRAAPRALCRHRPRAAPGPARRPHAGRAQRAVERIGRGRQAGRTRAHQGGVRKGRRRSRQAGDHELRLRRVRRAASASAWTRSASPWAASTTARGRNGAAGRIPTW